MLLSYSHIHFIESFYCLHRCFAIKQSGDDDDGADNKQLIIHLLTNQQYRDPAVHRWIALKNQILLSETKD